jgi:protein-L-isoaspartate(D-aspartate) O-methyltransferase
VSPSAPHPDVDFDFFVVQPNGTRLPHHTEPPTVAEVLRFADVRTGHRVLEIGTGSGYAAAVLGRTVGDQREVHSLELSDALAWRAGRLHALAGVRNVRVFAADGRHGLMDAAPYDRIISWVNPGSVPPAWVDQVAPGGAITTPLRVASLATATVLLRVLVTDDRSLAAPRVAQGIGFTEMAAEVVRDTRLPGRYVDAQQSVDGQPWWLSAAWVRDPQHDGRAAHLLRRLSEERHRARYPLGPEEDRREFATWLFARQPSGLSTAGLGQHGWGVACTRPDGIAVLCADRILAAGSSDRPVDTLRDWIRQWRDAGRPGAAALDCGLVRAERGWDVRLEVREPAAV